MWLCCIFDKTFTVLIPGPLTWLQQKPLGLREQAVVHDSLPHLRPGARLYPEVVDLVRREVVQVHLEGEMTWLNPLGGRSRESGGGCSLWPCIRPARLARYGNAAGAYKETPPPLPPRSERRDGHRQRLCAAGVPFSLFCRVILLQELATGRRGEERTGVHNQVPGRCVVALNPSLSCPLPIPLTHSLVLPDSTDCTNTQGLRRNEKRIFSVL